MRIRILLWALPFMALHAFANDESDLDAIEFEKNKQMVLITTKDEEQKYHKICQKIAAEDAAMDHEDFGDYAFSDDDDDGACVRTPSPSEPFVDSSETYIVDEIKSFMKSHAALRGNVKKIIDAHFAHCEQRGSEVLAVDFAIAIAQHFRKEGDVKHARHFYRLALESPRGYEDFVYLELGLTFLEYVNRVINTKRPESPTAEIFNALLEAIRYNSYDSGGVEPFSLGDARNAELIKHRDRMVRWPISPTRVLNDTYYGNDVLAKRLYESGFVARLLDDRDFLKGLSQLRNFNASSSEANIFTFLELHGFVGIRGLYAGAPQYILVNQKGFLVRVKRNPSTQKWELTVGLSMKNPVLWNSKGEAVRMIRSRDLAADGTAFGSDARTEARLVDIQANEVAKIVFNENGFIQILPPGLSPSVYWWEARQPIQQLMDAAHHPINPVGKYVKRTKSYDFKAIDSYCLSN